MAFALITGSGACFVFAEAAEAIAYAVEHDSRDFELRVISPPRASETRVTLDFVHDMDDWADTFGPRTHIYTTMDDLLAAQQQTGIPDTRIWSVLTDDNGASILRPGIHPTATEWRITAKAWADPDLVIEPVPPGRRHADIDMSPRLMYQAQWIMKNMADESVDSSTLAVCALMDAELAQIYDRRLAAVDSTHPLMRAAYTACYRQVAQVECADFAFVWNATEPDVNPTLRVTMLWTSRCARAHLYHEMLNVLRDTGALDDLFSND